MHCDKDCSEEALKRLYTIKVPVIPSRVFKMSWRRQKKWFAKHPKREWKPFGEIYGRR